MISAIRAHDAPAVREALARGASPIEVEGDPVEPDSDMTALACAVDENRPDLVRILLDAGAPVDHGRPLWHALRGDRHECLRLLLDAGADPNQAPDEDYAPLYTGVADPIVARLLLDAGADPNVATPNDETPLSFCASWGHLDSLELLLAAGADPNHRLRDLDWPVLFFAAEEGDEAVVRALIAGGADAGFVNDRGQTAAAVALDHRKPAVAERLLREGGAGFGAPSGPLRARLRITAGRPYLVDLDLQNVGPVPIEVDAGPSDLRWELLRDGVAVEARYGRTEILSVPGPIRIDPGYVAALRVSHRRSPEEGGPGADLDVVSVAWSVMGGEELRCTIPGGAVAAAPIPPRPE